jgi:hypothetical protein
MHITVAFVEAHSGTRLTFFCRDIPKGVHPRDNAMGCRQSLKKLAGLVE